MRGRRGGISPRGGLQANIRSPRPAVNANNSYGSDDYSDYSYSGSYEPENQQQKTPAKVPARPPSNVRTPQPPAQQPRPTSINRGISPRGRRPIQKPHTPQPTSNAQKANQYSEDEKSDDYYSYSDENFEAPNPVSQTPKTPQNRQSTINQNPLTPSANQSITSNVIQNPQVPTNVQSTPVNSNQNPQIPMNVQSTPVNYNQNPQVQANVQSTPVNYNQNPQVQMNVQSTPVNYNQNPQVQMNVQSTPVNYNQNPQVQTNVQNTPVNYNQNPQFQANVQSTPSNYNQDQQNQSKGHNAQVQNFDPNAQIDYSVTPPPKPVIEVHDSGPLITQGEMSFQISYQRKVISYSKRPVTMTQNDQVVFCCETVHDKDHKSAHVVCSSRNVSINSPDYEGKIVRHRSGLRFTLIGKSNEQLAGFSFYDLPGGDKRIRCFRVAIPNPGTVYNPADKELDLSKIALNNNSVDGVTVYSSVIPQKKPGGKLYINMAPYKVKRSLKNFMIRDKDDSVMFIIFKSVDNMCKVKTREPISPLIAFTIAVAVMTSIK